MVSIRFLLRSALGLALAVALQAAPIQWKAEDGGNDNWYEVITGNIFAPFTFEQSDAAAQASTHLGLDGYLATITSADEQQFILSNFGFAYFFGGNATSFIGATDTVTEGSYVWGDGPEAGQAVPNALWLPGYPLGGLGYEGHNYVQLGIFAGGTIGLINNTNGAGNYIVEYGDGLPDTAGNPIPEPSTVLLSAAGLAAVLWRKRLGFQGTK